MPDHALPQVPADCRGCGACCRTGRIPLAPDETLDLPPATMRLLDLTDHGPWADCPALDPAERICTIYDHRPRACREFERGSPACRDHLRWA